MSQNINQIKELIENNGIVSSSLPKEELLQRLKSIPGNIRETYEVVPMKFVWAAAASIALLICVNYYSFQRYDNQSNLTEKTSTYFNYLETL